MQQLITHIFFNVAVAAEEVQVPPPRQKQKPRPEAMVDTLKRESTSSTQVPLSQERRTEGHCQQTAVDVAIAAGAVAAAAALQVIQAAGKEVQAQLQVLCPCHALFNLYCCHATSLPSVMQYKLLIPPFLYSCRLL